MGQALADAFPICRETFQEADEALGESLSGVCFDGPEDRLTLTENTQPAILAMSTAVERLVARRVSRPPLRPGTASASTRRTWRPVRYPSRMPFAS